MKTDNEVDKIMETIPKEWRTHWCGGETGPCACMGCVQIGNRIIMWEVLKGVKFFGDPEYIDERIFPKEVYSKYKITKEEWEKWIKKS